MSLERRILSSANLEGLGLRGFKATRLAGHDPQSAKVVASTKKPLYVQHHILGFNAVVLQDGEALQGFSIDLKLILFMHPSGLVVHD